MKRSIFMGALLLVPIFLFTGARSPHRSEVRAIWVTRFDYHSPADVASIMVNCAKAGLTDIFFQVRGNGTAFYNSRAEPWAFELSGREVSSLGTDPGWDPLQMASSWAKRCHIRLHAYINVLPGWRGMKDPPHSAGQLWTAHPEWFMVDATGTRMHPTSAWYSFLNPAHPEVRRHLVKVVEELEKYELAGLHLDYIRFPYDYKDVAREVYPNASSSEIKAHSSFSFDPVSRAAIQQRKGRGGARNTWDTFRRASISQVLADLGKAFRSRSTQSTISASVLADLETGYHKAFQDSRRWVKEGRVDWLVPMNYNASLFDDRLNKIRHLLGRRSVSRQLVVGINCEGEAQEIRRQIQVARRAGCRGFALFAYSHLFKNHQPTATFDEIFQGE